jgi:hypothetical protein
MAHHDPLIPDSPSSVPEFIRRMLLKKRAFPALYFTP